MENTIFENLDFNMLTNILIDELINAPVSSELNNIIYNNNNNNTTPTEYDIFLYSSPLYNFDDVSVMANSLHENPAYKQVIDDEELNKLKKTKIKYTTTTEEHVVCPITQIEFNDEQEIIKLECGHCFDPEAILHWLSEEKSECPVCRFKYKSKEVKNVEKNNARNNLFNALSRVNLETFFL